MKEMILIGISGLILFSVAVLMASKNTDNNKKQNKKDDPVLMANQDIDNNKKRNKEDDPDWLRWILEESKYLEWIRRNIDQYPYVCNIASPILGGYLQNHFRVQCQLLIGEYKSMGYHVWLAVTDDVGMYYIDVTIQQFGGNHRIEVFPDPMSAPYRINMIVKIPESLNQTYCGCLSFEHYLIQIKKQNIHKKTYQQM